MNSFGNCEYCSRYSLDLRNIQLINTESLMWISKLEETFYKSPFWACSVCIHNLSKTCRYNMISSRISKQDIDSELLNTGHARNIMVRKLKTLEELFLEIDGIYILPPKEMPDAFKEKTNVAISFKNLNTLKYFKYIVQNERETLFSFWKDGLASKFQHRTKFYTTKVTRILMALSKIHLMSDLLAIWVWSDTRIVSIEFFCKSPANLTYIQPTKALRVT